METKNADLSSLKIDRSQKGLKNPEGKRIYWVITGVILLIIAVLFLLQGWNSFVNPPLEVKMTTAEMQSPSESSAILAASGYVVAQRKAAVASKGTGRLIYLGVVEGDKVVKDEVIARLDDSDIKAMLEQSKATLKLNEADLKDALNTFNRQKELLKSGSSTQADVDASEARYLRVLASIDLAKAQVQAEDVAMENMVIRAPFNGTVLTKNADVGEIVAPLAAGVNSKAAVVTIADMSSLQVEADVSESNIEKIKLDQDCEIRLDAYPDKAYAGYVAKIVPTADRSKATVMVKVGFKNYDKSVLPEMSAKVLFLSKPAEVSEMQSKQYLVIPESSIANRNGRKIVFVVRNDKLMELPVSTGKVLGGYVEITQGLNEGDKIVDSVTDEMKDGLKVISK